MRKLLPWFLVLAAAQPALAQEFAPALVVQNEGKPEPLGLVGLSVNSRLSGFMAETTATMTFANPQARQTEGDLYYPLPEGATVTGYTLDIHGQMVDGVIVERQRAQEVFETEKARRIDPGLVEWSGRDCFRTRVFPIPGHGRRIVRVRYVSELADGSDGAIYRLPLKFSKPIGQFSLRVEVAAAAAAGEPVVRQAAIAGLKFDRENDRLVAVASLENALLNKELVIALPAEKRGAVLEKADDGHVYFAVQDIPPEVAKNTPSLRPQVVVIYWDASGSRAGEHAREIMVLRNLLTSWTSSARPLHVGLVLLRNTQAPPQWFTLHAPWDAHQVIDAVTATFYDGGTQLGALSAVGGLPPFTNMPDVSLLFSDGISTFGSCEPRPLGSPLHVFSASPHSEWAVLEHLARNNGGQCFHLDQWDDNRVGEIAAAIVRPAWRPLPATVASGLVAGLQASVAASGRVSLVGRLDSPSAQIYLNYQFPGNNPETHKFAIDGVAPAKGSLLRHLWAQRQLEDLLIHEERNRQKIIALGKEFQCVTPLTSLLVLETLQQYLQYQVVPPSSAPEMLKAYQAALHGQGGSESQRSPATARREGAVKMPALIRMWDERVAWWTTSAYPATYRNHEPARPAYRQVTIPGLGQYFESSSSPLPRPLSGAAMFGSGIGTGGGMVGGMAGGLGGMGGGMGGGMMGGMGGGMGTFGGPGPVGGSGLLPAGRSDGSSGPASGASSETIGPGGLVNAVQYSPPAFQHRQPPEIVLQPCDSTARYWKELRAGPKDPFALYRKYRSQYSCSPDFFFDFADFFFDHGQAELAVQILSNVAEFESRDPGLLRSLANRLARAGLHDQAVEILEEVRESQPNEPQSYRDLALVLIERADAHGAVDRQGKVLRLPRREDPWVYTPRSDYARAVKLLTEVIERQWDPRFAEIELPALMELNRAVAVARNSGIKTDWSHPRLNRLLDLDLRIVVSWRAASSGLIFQVVEPSGETASCQHNRTAIGGLATRSTAGEVPQEYLLRRAMRGRYRIEATCGPASLPAPLRAQVDIFTNYGRGNEAHRSLEVRLDQNSTTIPLGEVQF